MEIIWSYFFISVFLMLFFLWLMYPEPRIILKMPNPKEDVSDLYVDDNGVCYRYHREEVLE